MPDFGLKGQYFDSVRSFQGTNEAAGIQPLKILQVHNFYGSSAPSGENQVVRQEAKMLLDHGHEVTEFFRYSDTVRAQGFWGLSKGAISSIWNPFSAMAIRKCVEEFRPDIVHVHNTFPLLSPSIFSALRGRAASVLTLHNYRLFCAAAIPMRNGQVCTLCLDRKSAMSSIRYGCYRGSRIATLPVAGGVGLHRKLGTWRSNVDAFVALTEFQREQMIGAGLAAEKIHIKPNFFESALSPTPWKDRTDRAVFVGRVSEEKGVLDLLSAWLRWGVNAPELAIVGDGPLLSRLRDEVKRTGAGKVRVIGQVSESEAKTWIAESKLLLLPSTWFEGQPMVLLEALALGTPMVVSDLGSLPEFVNAHEVGDVFRAADAIDLFEVVSDLWAQPVKMEAMSRRARQQSELRFGSKVRMLMKIYELAITSSGIGQGRMNDRARP